MSGELRTSEGVIIIHKDGEPYAMVRKNGKPQWFLLKEMSWTDVETFLEPDHVQS